MNDQPLKPCPCGETPDKLRLEEGYTCKYAYACGVCCDVWLVIFRTEYHKIGSGECYALAVEAWNGAKRRGVLPPLSEAEKEAMNSLSDDLVDQLMAKAEQLRKAAERIVENYRQIGDPLESTDNAVVLAVSYLGLKK